MSSVAKKRSAPSSTRVKKTVNEEPKVQKKVRSKKVEEVEEVEETVNEEVVEEQVEDTKNNNENFELRLSELLQRLPELVKEIRKIETEMKQIRTLHQKSIKDIQKETKSRKKRNPNTDYSNSIFKKPTKVSEELSHFLGIDKNETVLRPKVTQFVSKYIKENNLKNSERPEEYVPDCKLKKLLGEPRFPLIKKKPELGIGYSYKNLQTYLAKHYIK